MVTDPDVSWSEEELSIQIRFLDQIIVCNRDLKKYQQHLNS